uniref:Peripheral-type benzodiazepine receptor n=1 Tax=Eptatretus burgeri TaxID=7764 RepID=A0A8C4N7J5_EPTBU
MEWPPWKGSAAETVDILLLDGAIAATMFSWYSVNKTAAGLLLPYVGWMGLATALNYRIWQDNKEKQQ